MNIHAAVTILLGIPGVAAPWQDACTRGVPAMDYGEYHTLRQTLYRQFTRFPPSVGKFFLLVLFQELQRNI